MMILVIGGSGSGKSEYAEQRCMELDAGRKLYIATMEVYDEESLRRVARHRKMRSGKGFDTLECYTHLEDAVIPAGQTVLLECMSNLVANEMFSVSNRPKQYNAEEIRPEDLENMILQGVESLTGQALHIVIVTNQVFSDGISYNPETEKYRRCLAQVNRAVAALADEVIEVVCGIPLPLKREEGSNFPDINTGADIFRQ